MKPRVIPHMRSPAYVRGYIKGKVPGWRKERIAPGACLWIYWRVVAPVVRREIAGEKDTERKQEKGWLAGPDGAGLADRRHRRLTTIRFERFTFQASTSGGGIDYDHARREIADRIDPRLRERVVIACPDPHIERWYMADPESFASAVGVPPSVGKGKCKRDIYKAILADTICRAGLLAPLGGIEFAPELVEGMDLYRASRNDKSLKGFADELSGVLTRLTSPPLLP